MPARPQVKDDQLVRDPRGKIVYAALMDFDNAKVRAAFSSAAVHALIERFSHAFDERPQGTAA